MIDGSHLPYDENVALTKKVVEYAHQFDVTVEGELGVLAGVEDEVSADHHTYTKPDEVVDFVTKYRLRFIGYLYRYFSRCLQIQAGTVHTSIRRQAVWFLLHWHSTYWTV